MIWSLLYKRSVTYVFAVQSGTIKVRQKLHEIQILWIFQKLSCNLTLNLIFSCISGTFNFILWPHKSLKKTWGIGRFLRERPQGCFDHFLLMPLLKPRFILGILWTVRCITIFITYVSLPKEITRLRVHTKGFLLWGFENLLIQTTQT